MARCIAHIVFGAVSGVGFWTLVAIIAAGLATGWFAYIAALVAFGLSAGFITAAYLTCR